MRGQGLIIFAGIAFVIGVYLLALAAFQFMAAFDEMNKPVGPTQITLTCTPNPPGFTHCQ